MQASFSESRDTRIANCRGKMDCIATCAARHPLFTNSDFGRAYRSNGPGTDQGWGSCQFVLGGAVRGGDFVGRWPTLALAGPDDSGSIGRFIPTVSVDQYAATLAKWYGLPAADVATVFPNIAHFDTGTWAS